MLSTLLLITVIVFLLSSFNREITANGHITQLGIFHNNIFNHFNLSSDLMEPFRVLVDMKVFYMKPDKLEREEKLELVALLNEEVFIDGKKQFLLNAIKIYTKSILEALNENDVSKIRFFRDEL
jgi:CRISP-associated protein Cas1